MSCLDYGNRMLYGLSEMQLWKLQMVHNSAACLITGTKRRDHITHVMYRLHCLPVHTSCTVYTGRLYTSGLYSNCYFLFIAVHHLGPTYLSSLVTPYTLTKSLLLMVPRCHLECYGHHSFSVTGTILWNVMTYSIYIYIIYILYTYYIYIYIIYTLYIYIYILQIVYAQFLNKRG